MKKIISVLALSLIIMQFSACSKDENQLKLKEEVQEKSVKKKFLLSELHASLSDDELSIMGSSVGCELAKKAGSGPLTKCKDILDLSGNVIGEDCSNASSAYVIYLNTVEDPNFPEIYKEAVRGGWASCLSHGTPAGNSCSTVSELSTKKEGRNIYVIWSSSTICQANPIYNVPPIER